MWWKAVKILGAVSAVLVTLVFIVILILVTRPAVLLGVDGESLSTSLAGHSGLPDCRKQPDGSWVCPRPGRPPVSYRAEVNWMGCWKAASLAPATGQDVLRQLDGCIELGDIFTFE